MLKDIYFGMSVRRYLIVKICIIKKLVILVLRYASFDMLQNYPEGYFQTDFNYFPKDFTSKRANVVKQY